MPPTIDWATSVITVPKSDTSLVSAGPPEIRSHNTDTFRLQLKDIEDSEIGMAFLDTHRHVAPITVGGVALARVFEIINGYTVTYENGAYAVNLEGSNNNIGDVLNLNNVQVRSQNSAGLTFSKQVEDQSFDDARVYIDPVNGQPGTAFPLGTPGLPVDNLNDAQTIISNRTLPKRLFLSGTLMVGALESLANYNLKADSALLSSVNFAVGADATNAVVSGVTVSGDITGGIRMTDNCILAPTTQFEGSMVNGAIAAGTTKLVNTDVQNIIGFFQCTSIVAGTGTPIIDCNGVVNLELNVRDYNGGMELRNFSHASMTASVDLNSGHLVLHSSCTLGTIVVRGVGKLTDNSAGTTINRDGFVDGTISKYLNNKRVLDPTTGIETVYETDDTTAASTAQVYEDAAGTQTYRGQGAERRERRT